MENNDMNKKYDSVYIEPLPEDPSTKPYSPWEPITNRQDLKCLGKLGEECGELSQVVCRCIIQGVNQSNPDTNIINKDWLEKEIADVLANIRLVIKRFELDTKYITNRAEEKYSRIKDWQDNM